jgi:Zn-dependent peptidase ImmA (M78 family)
MQSVKVDVSPNILDWIHTVASFDGVDDKLLSHFYKWKDEEEQPTYAQIESLSKKIHIPLGYFFLKTPPIEHLPLLEFRTLNSASPKPPSRDLIDTYYQMDAIQEWMRDYLIDRGNDALPFIGSCKDEKNIEKIASSIRKTTGLALDWYSQSKNAVTSFNLLRKCFENIGILILKNGVVGQNNYRPLDINEFRAFTLMDNYVPLVFINSCDSDKGKLFSLVHEVAHIWLGLNSFYNDDFKLAFNRNPRETICNAVAAELLVPNKIFVLEWEKQHIQPIEEKIVSLAKNFRCGEIVIARRALDNHYISPKQYQVIAQTMINLFNKKKNPDSGGGNYYETNKSRYGLPLILALDNSTKEGKTLYTEAFRLTNTKRNTFAHLVAEIRGNI